MGVQAQITLYAPSEDAAQRGLEAAFAEIDRLESLLSDYQPASEFSRISRSAGSAEWVPVSSETLELLALAQELSSSTRGGFDITVGPAVDLWRQSRRAARLPDEAERTGALSRLGSHHLDLRVASRHSPSAARLMVAGGRLDPGGIGKGFAAERALRVLQRAGLRRAMVAIAGDVAVGDPPPGREGWIVAMSAGGPDAIRVKLTRASISTSGDREQFIEIQGRRYSHVVDPRTALGCTHGWAASVIVRHQDASSNSGAAADAVSTGLSVLGPDGAVGCAKALTAARTIDAAILWVPGLEQPIVIDPRELIRSRVVSTGVIP